MTVQTRIWKILGWGVAAALPAILMLLPAGQTLFSLDDGTAYAQTGPPPPPTPTRKTPRPTKEPPVPQPPPIGPPGCSTTCVYPLPADLPVVDIEYLPTPPPGIPQLNGEGIFVRVPSAEEAGYADRFGPEAFIPTITTEPALISPDAAIPVPSGLITEPVALIPFDFGPADFRQLGSLVVPTQHITDLIVRIEIVPHEQLPIPFDTPNTIPLDWYADPLTEQMELGYGAPIPILSPGVTTSNYNRVAEKLGLPPTPVPTPDAETAGVLETQPYTGTHVNVKAVFNLSIYNGITGEEITIHLPELVLVRCLEDIYTPHTPVLLQADTQLQRYDLPVQAHDRLENSDLPERITGYLLDTQNTFAIATLSNEIRPPLWPNQPELIPNPFAVIPLPPEECSCEVALPPGMPITKVDYLSAPLPGIPPLNGNGVLAQIAAAQPISPPLAAIPIPSGFITAPVGIVYFDLRPTYPAYATLIVPADPNRDLIARLQVLSPDAARVPIATPEAIPTDWYAVPHEQVWPELGYGAPIPISSAGVITTNYQRVAEKAGWPATSIPTPNAANARVIQTMPLTGSAINVEAVFDLDIYYADTGEEIDIHLPELMLGNFCFERNLSPHTPVLLRTNDLLGRYDIPVHQHIRYQQNYSLPEQLTAYLLETSTFVIATISGQVRPPITPDETYTPVLPSFIPKGLPNTGSAETGSTAAFYWGILLFAGGAAAILFRFYSKRS